jgi:NADPH:quinone reductase-like Zn-dependent oxidoreductase
MRAAIIREYGTVPEVGEFDEPTAGDGEVVVEVLAGALNPVDILMASGNFHQPVPDPPYVPGREGVGRTEDGTRAYFENPVGPFGPLAERALAKRESLVPLPEAIDDDLATCFGVAGLAAWLALERRAHVSEGDTVLVLGASGVVGLIAVQAAKLMGASRVVAAARNADGLARAAELGADATVRIDEADDLAEAFREATDGGPSVVLDPLWGEPVAAASEAAAKGARIVQLGQSAGPEATFKSSIVRGKELSILGHSNFEVSREERQAAYRRMVELCAAGQLTADVERVPLDQAPDAWKRQQEGPHHKLAIIP